MAARRVTLSTPLAGLLALVCALAASGVFAQASALARLGPALLLCGGLALPILLRWSPVEPSALKLGLLALLLSPPLCAALRLATGDWQLVLWVGAGLQLLGLQRPMSFERAGRAGWCALALALGLAWLFTDLTLGQGLAPRLDHDRAIWQAAAAEMLLRPGALENPFLAGTPFPSHPGAAALVAAVADGLRWPAADAAALVLVWSVATLPVALCLLAAPLWGELRRVLITPFLAIGLTGSPYLVRLLTGSTEETGWLALDRAPYAIGPAAPAVALGVGAWLCAVHALRHGQRPWVGLTALLGGLALLVHPAVGAVALGAPALAALCAPGVPKVRTAVPLSLALAALPGLWLVRRFGYEPAPLLDGGWRAGWGFGVALPALALCGGWRGSALRGAERRVVLTLLLGGALLALAAGLVAPGAGGATTALGLMALAPLAAGGLMASLEPGAGRAWRLPLALGLVALGLIGTAQSERARWRFARAPFQVQPRPGGVEPAFPSERELPGTGRLSPTIQSTPAQIERAKLVRRRHRAEAYRWIRQNREFFGEGAVLWRSLASSGDRERGGDRGRGGLRLHLAPLYTDLPLWCDANQDTAADPQVWRLRRSRVAALYEQQDTFDPHTLRGLVELGRPAVFLVEEYDRDATHRGPVTTFRGVDLELERLGVKRLQTLGTVSVYHYAPTP